MESLKTLKGLVLLFSAILLLASCTKSIQEIDEQNQRDVNPLSGHDCDIVVNLESWSNRNGFFFLADRRLGTRQNFNANNFTENNFFTVTANTGTPWHDFGSGSIGVAGPGQTGMAQRSIGAGESLWLTLSPTTFSGQLMSGFDVVLNGNSTTVGTITLYREGDLIETIPIAPTTATAQNFGISFQTPFVFGSKSAEIKFFDQIRFNCSAGNYRIYGPQPNGGPFLPTTKFYLANVAEAVYMRNRYTTGNVAAVRYINQGLYPNELDLTLRQTKSALADNVLGSGEYNNLNPDKWLKLSTNSGNQLVFNDGRIGVGSSSELSITWGAINLGEEFIIEPGTDFPSTHFGSIEIRQAVNPAFNGSENSRLDWVIYDGVVIVGSGSTNPTNNTYNFINPGVKFDRIILRGRTTSSTASLGRFSDEVISAYPACD